MKLRLTCRDTIPLRAHEQRPPPLDASSRHTAGLARTRGGRAAGLARAVPEHGQSATASWFRVRPETGRTRPGRCRCSRPPEAGNRRSPGSRLTTTAALAGV